jgi:hypothetical protein
MPHLPPKDKRTPDETRDFLDTARKRFQLVNDAEWEIREEAKKDNSFLLGDQWDPRAKQIRDDDNRPCLTINRLPQFIHQVTNEERKQRPSLAVSPEGGPEAIGSEELRTMADIWQGLLRHIEVRCDAATAYDTAFESMVGISFGWFRVNTQYAGDDTFDLEIVIDRILDAFSVYSDPSAKKPDRSDMKWAFVTSRLSRDDFKREFKDSDMVVRNFYTDFDGGPGPQWLSDDDVQIAEYFVVDFRKRQLQQIGASTAAVPELVKIFGEDKVGKVQPDPNGGEGTVNFTAFRDEYTELPAGAVVEDERDVQQPSVMWYKISGTDILDETEWAGKWIPLIPCFGHEAVKDGKNQLISLTRFIRDSQVLLNFFRSQQAEVIALTPKAPFIGPVGAFKTHRSKWQTANNQNYAYLEYDMVPLPNGTVAPPPQRNTAEPPIQALTHAVADADNDLKAGSGIYAPALGQPSNETSGRAIFARQAESDTSNYHFLDNFRRSMRHLGRMLMDLIPHIYDRKERIIRIIKPDNDSETVMINGNTTYKGKPVFFDPSVGRYDVTVEVQPSYATKMEQTFEMLTELVKVNPQLMQVAGDLVMRAAPLPGNLSSQIADRLKALLPPQILDVANGNQPTDPRIPQATQMIQQLTQQIQQLQLVIKTKVMEMESKERIANLNAIAGILEAAEKAKSEGSQMLTQEVFSSIKHRLDLLHQSMGLQQEAQSTQVDQQQAQQGQQFDQEHAMRQHALAQQVADQQAQQPAAKAA